VPEIELHSRRSGRRRRRFAGGTVLLALVVGSAALVLLVVAAVEPAPEQPPALLALPDPPPVEDAEPEPQGGLTPPGGEQDIQPGVEEPVEPGEPGEPAPPAGSIVSLTPTLAAVPTQVPGASPLGSPGPILEPTPEPEEGPEEGPDDDTGAGPDDPDGDERRLRDALSPLESIVLEGVGHVAPAAVPVLASAFGLTGHLLDTVEDGLPIRSGAGRR